MPRSRIAAWALWDCGATGLNAVVVTFVFSVYLTDTVGRGVGGDTSPASALGRAMTLAGVMVALLAPLTGVLVQAPHRRRVAVATLTALAAATTAAMSLIRADPRYLVPGLVLLALAAASTDLASVPYNAMLRQVSTPANAGRISGWAWPRATSAVSRCYCWSTWASSGGRARGLLGVVRRRRPERPRLDADDGRLDAGLRAAAAGGWPQSFRARRTGRSAGDPRWLPAVMGRPALGWHRDRNLVYYLFVSAVFRDGLTGVFAFGAVLGVTVYGISQADVLIFGIVASTVAALGPLPVAASTTASGPNR